MFSRKLKRTPKAPQCKQCKKEARIVGRKDGLGKNCAHFIDQAKRAAKATK